MKRLNLPFLLVFCAVPAQTGLAQSGAVPTLLARLPAPAVSLAYAGQLYVLTQQGELWANAPLRKVVTNLSITTPLASCNGKVMAITPQGQLWWGQKTNVMALSPVSGLACAPGGAVLAVGNQGELVRIEASGQESSRADLHLLPDARPRFADLQGNHDPLLMVLAAPSGRYPHGVIGDKLEATELLAIDRHTLRVEYRLSLPTPFVFEDWEARPVQDGKREVAALVRSSVRGGAALVIVGLTDEALTVLAAGPDFGQPFRWLAPITDGKALYAVHTPHIGGVLNLYTWNGKTLTAQPVPGVPKLSNHRIGQRFITGGVWRGVVWAGTQTGDQTVDTAGLPPLNSAPSTPLLTTSQGAYLGLQDGSLVRLP